MFIAVYADRKHLPWLIGVAATALLIGLGVLVS
jgi:hypothetical protein